jgi:hypothetical protein
MSFKDKVKNSITSKAAEGLAVAASVIVLWAASKITPVLLPAIESALSKEIVVSLLLASLALNIIIVIIFWVLHKKPEFKLKYGIYWDIDKNPHCPNCKIPIGKYGEYQSGGKGYYCKPCGKIFSLTDASGNHIDPEQVIKEL